MNSANDSRRRLERVFLLVASVLAWAGLIVQYIALSDSRSPGATIWLMLSFLTIITNLLTAYLFTRRLLRRDDSPAHWTHRPSPQTWVCVSITFVGIAFALLLAGLYQPEGLDAWANTLLHYVTPALGLIYWLAFLRTGELDWTDALIWSTYVIAYGIYAMVRGGITGSYPYPFLELPTVGFASVALHIAGLFFAFCLLGLVFVFIDRTWPMSRREGAR